MRVRKLADFTGLAVASLLITQVALFGQEKLEYPESKQVNQVDNFFGTPVADPYRWLEDDVRNSESVREWVDSQNALTFSVIKQLPYRNEIKARLTKLWDYEKFGTPFKRGERYFYFKNNGLQNQSVLYKLKSLEDEPIVLIDPNQWSADGTNALGGLEFSNDGKLLAYGVQKAGSDWRTWKVMDVETGEQLSDELNWIKFGSVSWTKDSKGFFYSCYDEPKSDEKFQGLNLGQKVYYHRIGDSQDKDQLIHENPENPKFGFLPEVSEDGKYLVITVWQGTDDRYRVLYQNLDDPNSKLTALIENFENEYSFLGNDGSRFYFKSDFNAPKKCILSIDTLHPEQDHWKVIVPESDDSMESAGIVGKNFIVQYLQDAKSLVKLYKLDGKYAREVKLPGIGTASGFGGRRDQKETFYSFSSFNRPPSVYRYDLETGISTLIREANVDFNPDDFVVKQVFYKSKDGTQVPMFIAHKKGLELNGKNPTLLYAYGGFNISLTPSFSISRLQWMEMGGVFAMPNLRGGGEYGKAWHKAGTKTNKQNVFDDFIAAAEYLIAKGYTSADHLGIQGGSNGGLLVGACMAQRPDLYGACLPAVGVMDMLRFHKFTAGRFWVDDYGSSEASAEEFNALFAYSPYHNLVDGEEYPPTMVTTADTDDRVVPGHSFKFAARLQAAQAGSNPVLIRIETKAGHGAGKPTAKIIEEYADQWAFLAKHLGLTPQFPSK
ncbi:prolyl oligopeptidase family serine peptidase [bacterium]|nr:prolyl oligopeptidase family serine peptidase [bacterium]